MNVLSLFDGISCGAVALNNAGLRVDNYYASEVDKKAIFISRKNHPQIQHVGDVTKLKIPKDFHIDLLIGGSPCQDLRPGRDGLSGKKSKLFYEYLRILKEVRRYNPDVKFLLENVAKISADDKAIITELLGVSPVLICSSHFSAQKRRRLYWTNIEIPALPPASSLTISDIIDTFSEKEWLSDTEVERGAINHSAKTWHSGNKMGAVKFPTPLTEKAKTLITLRIKGDRSMNHVVENGRYRLLTPTEYERLQTLPDNYTLGLSNKDRCAVLGNGWTVKVITHILSGLPIASHNVVQQCA